MIILGILGFVLILFIFIQVTAIHSRLVKMENNFKDISLMMYQEQKRTNEILENNE